MKVSPIAVALGAALVLTGCSASDSLNDLSAVTHVHNVVIHDGQVLAGTHEGLYAQQEDGRWLLLGEKFDVMGLTAVDGQLLVSGHPRPNFPFPDPLGLLESDNSGETWSSRGLTGEVDFHLLDASANTIVGAAANLGALIRSEDRGTSWEPLTVNALTDFALNPANPEEIVVASPKGLQWSRDGGATFDWVYPETRVEKLDWSEGGLMGATATGVWMWDSAGAEWLELQDGFQQVYDIAGSENQVAVLDGFQVSMIELPLN